MAEIITHKPAEGFPEAMLLGNGHIGAAVWGHPTKERIMLSHNTFFSGCKSPDSATDQNAASFLLARKAIPEQNWEKADESIDRFIGKKGNYGTSLPVGYLLISQPDRPVGSYTRSLDLMTGVSVVSFGTQTRTMFCSHPDQLFCLLIEDTGQLSLSIELTDVLQKESAGNSIRFSTQALETLHSDGQTGVRLSGLISVSCDTGNMESLHGSLSVSGAHRCLITLRMVTDYCCIDWDQTRDTLYRLPQTSYTAWGRLYDAHVKDFGLFMRRQSLSVPNDPAAGLLYHFGRYLILSGSREDSPLPMSLQGVWNDDVACRIGWTCDMHLDINTQMNYWLCESGALPESHVPLFRWMENVLIPSGRENAAKHYGCRGWAAELVSNAWGYAEPYWNKSLAPCPACGLWTALDYAEHYRRTKDEHFLREHALPVLEEAADFITDYLFEDTSGLLQSGPSISPENAFMADGKKRYASISPTFEISMIRATLENLLELRASAGMTDWDRDVRLRQILSKLPPLRILPDGSIAEWAHDYPAKDPQHRHLSHLAALFPLEQITPESTPLLAQAAAKTIERRLDPYEQWEDTGWSRSMLMLYSARLGDGDKAQWHLHEMIDRLMNSSMKIMHPSTRGASSFAPVWELDGNTGAAAGISEMLLQSHGNILRLLPALPGMWKDGCYTGIRARGGFTVDITWAEHTLTACSITASCDTILHLAYHVHSWEIPMKANETIHMSVGKDVPYEWQ